MGNEIDRRLATPAPPTAHQQAGDT
jgi:hypothetical protein